MERINGQMPGHRDLAKHVLAWITCAKWRLTTTELQHAWAVRDSENELDEDGLPEVEEMVSVCAGLVTLDHDGGIIRLVHYTTQEYFEQTLDASFPNAHFEIARTCVSYLSFSTFSNGECKNRTKLKRRLETNPLYHYAARNWGYHAHKAADIPDEVLDFLERKAHVSAAEQAWRSSYRGGKVSGYNIIRLVTTTAQGLHLAAQLGLASATTYLLAANHDPNMADHIGRTPLIYAAAKGNLAVVQTLLATGKVDVNAADSSDRTPLYDAIQNGHTAVVQALLHLGKVDVKRRGWYGATPLIAAVKFQREAVVQQLLASKMVDIEGRDEHGWTALRHVVEGKRNAGIVRLLLAYGAQDLDENEELDENIENAEAEDLDHDKEENVG